MTFIGKNVGLVWQQIMKDHHVFVPTIQGVIDIFLKSKSRVCEIGFSKKIGDLLPKKKPCEKSM